MLASNEIQNTKAVLGSEAFVALYSDFKNKEGFDFL